MCFAELCCFWVRCVNGGTQLGVMQADQFWVQTGYCLQLYKVMVDGRVFCCVSSLLLGSAVMSI